MTLISAYKKAQPVTVSIMDKLQSGTVDRNVICEFVSFKTKTVQCSAYDIIPTKRYGAIKDMKL